MGRLILQGFIYEVAWVRNVVSLRWRTLETGMELRCAILAGYTWETLGRILSPERQHHGKEGIKEQGLLSSICSWSHPESLHSQTPHFIHLSENISPSTSSRVCPPPPSATLWLHQDFESHYPTRSMTFIHLLPDATFAPPSQAVAYPPHLLAFTVPALFFSQLFF